jgi:NAD-dependent dihydropyrimidine dehydrogenase PreA subunit
MNVVYIGLGIIFFLMISEKLHSKKKRRNKVIRVVEDNCTGCQRCVKRCSHHVLEIISDEKRARVVVKNPDRCTACGDCIGKCKFNALEVVERK